MRDEELRAVRVRTRICHRQDAGSVMFQFGMKFIFELVTWTAGSRSMRAPTLNHEILDDAVKLQAIVEAFVRELLEVRARLRCLVVKQLNLNFATVRFDGYGLQGNAPNVPWLSSSYVPAVISPTSLGGTWARLAGRIRGPQKGGIAPSELAAKALRSVDV